MYEDERVNGTQMQRALIMKRRWIASRKTAKDVNKQFTRDERPGIAYDKRNCQSEDSHDRTKMYFGGPISKNKSTQGGRSGKQELSSTVGGCEWIRTVWRGDVTVLTNTLKSIAFNSIAQFYPGFCPKEMMLQCPGLGMYKKAADRIG